MLLICQYCKGSKGLFDWFATDTEVQDLEMMVIKSLTIESVSEAQKQ
jgi:hypothetical protein